MLHLYCDISNGPNGAFGAFILGNNGEPQVRPLPRLSGRAGAPQEIQFIEMALRELQVTGLVVKTDVDTIDSKDVVKWRSKWPGLWAVVKEFGARIDFVPREQRQPNYFRCHIEARVAAGCIQRPSPYVYMGSSGPITRRPVTSLDEMREAIYNFKPYWRQVDQMRNMLQ